jgi:phosphonate metabolism-associated iron-containing alcohol dehydrogenase
MTTLPQDTPWSHSSAISLSCGIGALEEIKSACDKFQSILLVTSKGNTQRGVTERVIALLEGKTVTVIDEITPNPEVTFLDQIAHRCAASTPDCIIALGGGSSIDAGKILSVAIPSGQSRTPIADALARPSGQNWTQSIPVIAVPTTAGTGAEVTPFATIWDQVNKLKHSVAGNAVRPSLAIADPTLTVSLPREETLNTGLDTISHALESLWNKNRTPVSEAYAVAALNRAYKALPSVLTTPTDVNARQQMQEASMLAGLAIAQTKTAIAHSISYPLTSHFGVPHGLACSFTLPAILRQYIASLTSEDMLTNLLSQVLVFLESLQLDSELARYASASDIQALKAEMNTPGRADNLSFSLNDGVDGLLKRSTS